jgi:phage terminase large subunit
MQADYTENERMLESDVAEARRSMSKAEFEQEYMASFNTFEGQIYKFSDELIVEFEHSDGVEYLAGIDPGYRDPTAMVVVAYDPKSDVFHVVDEYLEAEKTTAEHAVGFQKLITKHGGLMGGIFIDSAAAQFAGDLAYGYDISTIKAKKQVLEGIAYVQTLVEGRRIKVAPHCTHTLQMFDQYQWDNRDTLTREKPVHNKVSHIADALRYCLYTYTL